MNLLGLTALVLFLLAGGNGPGTVALVAAVWLGVLAAWLAGSCLLEKRRLKALLAQAEQLDERYLLPEILPPPATAEEAVYRRLMQMAEKSMLEQVGTAQRERREYREYIEQWIHEIKTPITAGKLLCENDRSPLSREMLAQLERITHYTEQALYYARSEHTEKDYLIREIRLADVVHGAIADNKYLLRQNRVEIMGRDISVIASHPACAGQTLRAIIGAESKVDTASPAVRFALKPGKVLLFDRETEERIRF